MAADSIFNRPDEQYLLRRMARNEVVLFLGAGFSADTTNQAGDDMPLSRATAEKLWTFLEYPGSYDGTSLPDMYDALLNSGISHARIQTFLEQTLLTNHIPEEYDALVPVFWYRIYTTNIDDLLPRIYRRAVGPSLDVLAYPRADPRERDQALDKIQAVYLHGLLPCKPTEVVFSVRQYARQANEHSPLYQNFILDYATYPTIFIGTELNEPLFWQHIEARERRSQGVSEQRPQSFLISPRIAPPKRAQLEPFNVTPVEATAEEFLRWLSTHLPSLPSRQDVLRTTLPSVIALLEATEGQVTRDADLVIFGDAFHIVPTGRQTKGDRSFYLLGATPRWEDLFQHLDAPREITNELLAHVDGILNGLPNARVVALLGSAGSGKSTILRRLGLRLAQAGRAVFLTNSEDHPEAKVIASALTKLGRPAILLFDNSEVVLGKLAELVEATNSLPHPPILVVAARSNDYDRRSARLETVAEVREFDVPHLERAEIIEILKILDQNGLLGRLQGLRQDERIREFEDRERAGKQLLVAMREATSGRGFDEIIRDEFDSLPNHEVRQLYLCVALATDAGYRLTRQQFVGCARVAPAEALHALDRNLKSIVIPTGAQNDLLLLRHRTIAEYMLNIGASRSAVAEAYVRLLTVLASLAGSRVKGRGFGLYRELVNHQQIYDRFESDIGEARAIYDSIASFLSGDAHFWLQYGLLELEFGNLELAENYLHQAESLYPNSKYIRNSLGYLYLKKAVRADRESEAYQYRAEGSELLLDQIDTNESPYPYHIYCTQRLAFAQEWCTGRDEMLKEIEHLRKVVKEGRHQFQRNGRLRYVEQQLEARYLALGLKDE